jgi:DNA-nicking Smr family endonuclease
VLIGEEEFLYKSSKSSRQFKIQPHRTDLHGWSKEEAYKKLDDLLPSWIDAAKKDSPWTYPVDIICGGGNHILADAVAHWVRNNRRVANRFV